MNEISEIKLYTRLNQVGQLNQTKKSNKTKLISSKNKQFASIKGISPKMISQTFRVIAYFYFRE